MEIHLAWQPYLKLRKSPAMGYDFEHIEEELQPWPGIYVFARKHGTSFIPIYVGQAKRIRGRLKMQFRSLPLMKKVQFWNPKDPGNPEAAKTGARVLFVGYIESPVGEKAVERALNAAEQALIWHALSEGVHLVNVQKTNLWPVSSTWPKGMKANGIAPIRLLTPPVKKKPAALAELE